MNLRCSLDSAVGAVILNVLLRMLFQPFVVSCYPLLKCFIDHCILQTLIVCRVMVSFSASCVCVLESGM